MSSAWTPTHDADVGREPSVAAGAGCSASPAPRSGDTPFGAVATRAPDTVISVAAVPSSIVVDRRARSQPANAVAGAAVKSTSYGTTSAIRPGLARRSGALGYVGGVLKRESNFQLVPWEPGQSGKGLLVLGGDPSIHTFCYSLYHQQAADALGLRLNGSVLSFVISPCGEVHVYADRDVNGQSAEQVIAGLDDRLRPGAEPFGHDLDDIWDEGPNEDGRSDLVGDGL